jgi:POT family proton-dependent oligopeptide transporter
MKAILAVFMTGHLMNADGELATMTKEESLVWIHMFVAATYGFPLLGAVVADALWGKYQTIIRLSIVYCLGHLALALDETRIGLFVGLSLIAIGAGGIKPCVSAHVGDQFGTKNEGFLPRVFSWFYFSINFGAVIAQGLTPLLLKHMGPHVAFGVPGVLMAVATVCFWAGRNKFAHIQPTGKRFFRETFSREGLGALGKLVIIYVFVAMFWALFDQTASAWVLQAKELDPMFLGVEWLPAQPQAANPILVLAFIPLFSYVLYPAIDKVFKLSPLRKISIGLFITVFAFLIPAHVETLLASGDKPSIGWQFIAYVILTAAEIMVSITCLEFSYTQAPKKMKSLVMGLFLFSVTLGNLFTAGVNQIIQNPDGTSKLAGADYYYFFSGTMLLTAVLFVPVAMRYKERRYIFGDEGGDAPPSREPAGS